VLNKKDLIDNKSCGTIKRALQKADNKLTDVIFTNCKDSKCQGFKKVRGKGQSRPIYIQVQLYKV